MKLKNTFKILIGAAILVPALVVGVVGTACYVNFYESTVTDRITSLTAAKASQFEFFFEKYGAQMVPLSKMDEIKRAASGDYAAISDQVDEILQAVANDDANILDVLICDGNGIIVTSCAAPALSQKTFEAYDDPLLNTPLNEYYVSPLFMQNDKYFNENGNAANVVYISKPVEISEARRGYICAAVSSDGLLQMNNTFMADGQIIAIDTNGNAANYNSATTRLDSLPQNIQEFISELNASDSVSDSRFMHGVIGTTGWRWISPEPSHNIGSITAPIMFSIAVLLLLLLISTVLAFMVYRFAITPIGKITNAIQEIKNGDRETLLPNFKSYEFQVISDVFNSLVSDAYISEEIHRTISDMFDNMLFEWNLDENQMYASENFKSMFDLDIANVNLLDGKFLDSLMNDSDAAVFRRDMSLLCSVDKDYVEHEYEVRTRQNTKIWVKIDARSIATRLGNAIRIIGVVTDINNEKKASMQLSQRASYDFLSQLYNRSTFLRELQNKLDMKHINDEYAILFIDVDDFKFINDRYSHNVGDEVIKYVSDTIKASLGSDGFAGRFGGDEFVMCVTNPAKTKDVDNFAMNLIDTLYQGYNCESAGVVLNIRASVGISLAPKHGINAEELVGAADEAMYFVKKNGKSNYHVFDPSDVPALDRLPNTLT